MMCDMWALHSLFLSKITKWRRVGGEEIGKQSGKKQKKNPNSTISFFLRVADYLCFGCLGRLGLSFSL